MFAKHVRLGIPIAMIICLTIVVLGCNQTIVPGYGPPITGSGVLKTQELEYSNFDSIIAGSAFKVDVTRADSYSVNITMDDNLFEYLQIDQNSGTLTLQLAPNRSYIRTIQRATIKLPTLHRLELTGASQGKIEGFSSSDKLDVSLSGASDLNIDSIKTGDTRFNISGASHMSGYIEMTDGRLDLSGASTCELAGSAGNVLIDVSGASNARLSEFRVVDANINLSGASRATVSASGRLDADASGASTLNYIGSPTLGKTNTSGGSTISQK
jgi:hypothetical protein